MRESERLMKTSQIDGFSGRHTRWTVLTAIAAGAMLAGTTPATPALALAQTAAAQTPTPANSTAPASKNTGQESGKATNAQQPSVSPARISLFGRHRRGLAPVTRSGTHPRFSPGTQAILKMVKHKVEPEVILAFIKNSPVAYRLSADEIIALQHDGVPGSVLAAMLQHGATLRAKERELAQAPPATAAAPPSQPAPSVPAPAYSYVYPPYTSGYLGYGSPYGAVVTFNNSYPTYINGYPVYSYGYYGAPYYYYPSYNYPYYCYPYYYSYSYPYYYGLNTFSFYPFGFFGGRFHYGFEHRFGHFDRDFDDRGIFPGRGFRPGFAGFNRAFGLHGFHGTVPFRGHPGGFVSGFGVRRPGGLPVMRGGRAFGGFRGGFHGGGVGGFHGGGVRGGGFHGRR